MEKRTNQHVLARSVFTMSLFLILLLLMVIPANVGNPGQLVIIVIAFVLNVCFIGYLIVKYRQRK